MKAITSEENTLTVAHFDMDAFFAAIEQRDDPKLKGKPLIIGGDPDGRGVVSTASYEARIYGVHSAMSAKMAKQLCPQGIFMRPNMLKYKQVSKQIREVFYQYAEVVEPVSIDEAFLQIPNDSISITQSIQQNIKNQIGLTASAGVSYNRFLAKMASEMEKPNGLTILTPEKAKEVLPTLKIEKIWGVGLKTRKALNDIGIETIQDLLNYDRHYLLNTWGRRGEDLIQLAQGIDNTPIGRKRKSKSIGTENTLEQDTVDVVEVVRWLALFSEELATGLQEKEIKARTITIKIKFSTFESVTRAHSLSHYTNSKDEIFNIASILFKEKVILKEPIRLIGLTVSNLLFPNEPIQLSMMDE
jgi:DNA polymerase-4